jgi:IMP dehydrogenase
MTCKVSHIMTPREKLVTVPEGTTPEQAKVLLNQHKIERCWWSTMLLSSKG